MKFLADIEQEADVRWLAKVMELPGVMSYGKTPDLATIKCEAA